MVVLAILGGCSGQETLTEKLGRADEFFEKEQYAEAVVEYMNVLRMDETNHVAILRSGLAHYELGSFRNAMSFLLEAKKHDPNNLEVRSKAANILYLARKLQHAREQALEILEQDPRHFDGLLLLIETAGSEEEVTDAYGRLKELESDYADRARYHLGVGSAFFKQRKYDAAEQSFLRARELEPSSVPALQALASLYASNDNMEKADEMYAEAVKLAPPASTVRVRWAAVKYGRGEPEEAKKLLRETVAEAPGFLLAWGQLAQYALSEGRIEECEEALQKILKKNPNDFGGRLLRARVLWAKGEVEDAVDVLKSLSEQYPRSAELRQQLALAELRNGDIHAAIGELRLAVQLDPTLDQALLQLADLSIRAGNASSVLADLVALTKRRPNLPQAQVLLGTGYVAEGEISSAVKTFRALSENFPDSHVGPFLLAGAYVKGKAKSDAIAAYDEALRRKANFLPALARRVSFDLEEGQVEEAVARVRTAQDIDENQSGLHFLLGSIQAHAGDTDAAEKAFRKEIEMNPKHLNSYLSLARLLTGDDQVDEALKELDQALTVDEDNVTALMLRGVLYERKEAYEKALASYDKILAANPDFAVAANNAAYLHMTQTGNLNKAFDLAKRARDVAPNDAAIADTLGWVIYHRGDYPRALTLIKEAAESYSEHPDVIYHLGMVYAAVGQEALASETLSKALSLGDSLPDVERVSRLVDLLNRPIAKTEEKDRVAVESVLSDNPDDVSALVRQGVLFERAGDARKAQTIFQNVLEKNPYFYPANVCLASYFDLREKNVGKALEFARKAREQAPGDPEVAHLAGWLAFRSGDFDWAHSCLREANQALPQDPMILYHYGRSTFLQGKVIGAVKLVKKALKVSQEFRKAKEAIVFLQLAKAMESGSISDKVFARAQTMVKTEPNFAAAQMVIGLKYVHQKKYVLGQEIFQSLIERQPRFVPAAKSLAILYGGPLNDDDQAYTWAMKARESLPDDLELSFLLGKIIFRRGEYDWAVRLLEKCDRMRPDHSETLFYLGMCQAKQNNSGDARQSLERALSLSPSSPHAAEARKILSNL